MIPKIRSAVRWPTEGGYELVGGLIEIDGHLVQAVQVEVTDDTECRVEPQLVELHGLAVQISDDDYMCANCGAFNTVENESFASFGGTTEGYEKCSRCEATVSWLNDSAVR